MSNPLDEPKTNEPNTSNEHVVVPVHVGDGEVQHIAFPASTPLPIVHKALMEHVEPPDIEAPKSNWAPYTDPKVDPISGRPRPNYGPTKEGVVENSPEFKASAKAIY